MITHPGRGPVYVAALRLVVARDYAGRSVYVYQNAPIPASVPHAEIVRLAADGAIVPIGADHG